MIKAVSCGSKVYLAKGEGPHESWEAQAASEGCRPCWAECDGCGQALHRAAATAGRMHTSPGCFLQGPFAFLAWSLCHGLRLSSEYNICGRSLLQLSWESRGRPDGLFKLKVSSVCLQCLKIFGKLPLVVLVTA